jgi:polysaccharide deacetylase family protein (PEP-CTERM system associated)
MEVCVRPVESRPPVVLSFDVEEHHRIEAAAGMVFPADLKRVYADRMEASTRRLLDQLAASGASATFYIVGQIAESHPGLVREIAAAGHEIGSHSWEHLRVHRFNPTGFAEDLKRSIEALQQAAGIAVAGFRAPTFSVVRETAWAVDVLAEAGLRYDSSVFPVRHDRYGVPDAPRTPFLLQGRERSILELPPLTYRRLGQNLPVAGGGYFRLFPLAFMKAGIGQMAKRSDGAGLSMLYFHPWEFDPGQPHIPLGRLSRFRTYVGIGKSSSRLQRLMAHSAGCFRRAVDVVGELEPRLESLPRFELGTETKTPAR